MLEMWIQSLGWEDPLEWQPTPVFLGFPCSSADKESACSVGDLGSVPGLVTFLGEGKGHPYRYFGLENSMDCIVYGFAKSWTWLSDLHFHFYWRLKGKESTCQSGDGVSITGLGRSVGEGNGSPLQYSSLGNPMDRGAWWATFHGSGKESDMTQWLNNNNKLNFSVVIII